MFRDTYTLRIVTTFTELFITIAPFFLVAILVQVVLSRAFGTRILRFSGTNELVSVVLAALVGMASPLPTYVAVPIGISFLALGAPLSAVIAFVIASPLLNPSVWWFTLTQLGLKIAILRVVTTFCIATVGGILAGRLLQNPAHTPPHNPEERHRLDRPFWMEFYRSTLFLGRYFLAALLISAAVKSLVSPQWIARLMGDHAHQGIVIGMALGVPFYSCGGAAIPLIQALRDMGMSDGAVMAFFIAGPATKLETLFIYKSLLGGKPLTFYLALTFLGAYLSGLLVFMFFP